MPLPAAQTISGEEALSNKALILGPGVLTALWMVKGTTDIPLGPNCIHHMSLLSLCEVFHLV